MPITNQTKSVKGRPLHEEEEILITTEIKDISTFFKFFLPNFSTKILIWSRQCRSLYLCSTRNKIIQPYTFERYQYALRHQPGEKKKFVFLATKVNTKTDATTGNQCQSTLFVKFWPHTEPQLQDRKSGISPCCYAFCSWHTVLLFPPSCSALVCLYFLRKHIPSSWDPVCSVLSKGR